MEHETATIIGLHFLLIVTHLLGNLYVAARVILFILSILYVLYNLRVQINNAGGLKAWLNNWKKWEK